MTVGVIKRDSVKIYYMVLGIVGALQFINPGFAVDIVVRRRQP